MFQLNGLLLPDPEISNFELDRAQELLNLTDEAHKFFEATNQKWDEWKTNSTALPPIKADSEDSTPKIINNWSEYELITHLIDKRTWSLNAFGWELVGFVAKSKTNPEHLFVVLRGTTTAKEWANNIRIIQDGTEKDNDVEIHRGFHRAYIKGKEPLREQINNALRPFISNEKTKIFVTGHSRGGALATVAAYFILQDLLVPMKKEPENMFLYTFASPRVGDSTFARKFDKLLKNSFRLTNSEDVVPKFPLAISLGVAALSGVPGLKTIVTELLKFFPEQHKDANYEHIGQPIYFTAQKGSIANNHTIPVYRRALEITKGQTI